MFKKPKSRLNVRKRDRAADEPADGATAADDEGGTSSSLELMRELQKRRQRAKGTVMDQKGKVDEVDEALGDETPATTADGLSSTFTTQADSGDIDQNMLKYIEEQMQAAAGSSSEGAGEARGSALESEEAQLYTTPAHLIGVVPAGMGASDETEDSANRWLAGIMEVPLSTEEKIAAIEQTEKAKRAMMDKQRAKQEMREKEQEREHHTLVMPGNYNSNFHQHRRENAIARKSQFGGKGGGGPGGGGGRGLASDAAAMGRFRAHERRMGR